MSERGGRAERLRKSFDEIFARPPEIPPAQTDMLLVTVGETVRAVRLEQISRVARNPGTVRVPARAEAFVGVAGLRGTVLPVFSLAALLGLPAVNSDWLLIVQGNNQQDALAFACESVQGYVRVAVTGEKISGVVNFGGENYSVVDLYALRTRLEIATRSNDANG